MREGGEVGDERSADIKERVGGRGGGGRVAPKSQGNRVGEINKEGGW